MSLIPGQASGVHELDTSEIFTSSRLFYIERFAGPMRRFLLRSPKDEKNSTRIDLMFLNTEFICIPSWIRGIRVWTLKEHDDEDREILARHSIERIYPGSLTVYKVQAGETDGYVIAANAFYAVDEMGNRDPSSLVIDA